MLLVLVIIGCGTKSEKPKVAEEPFIVMAKKMDSTTVAAVTLTGDTFNIKQTIGEITSWLGTNQITPLGEPFALFYVDSNDTPTVKVCIPVPRGTDSDPNAGIEVETLLPMSIFLAPHRHPYKNIQTSYDRLIYWIKEQRLNIVGPAIEFYLTQEKVLPESMKIHIGFPVKPMDEPVPQTQEEEGSC
ncbi:MAG: GyrI-like domain-containing protein [candidate division WOR-3 bacterium]